MRRRLRRKRRWIFGRKVSGPTSAYSRYYSAPHQKKKDGSSFLGQWKRLSHETRVTIFSVLILALGALLGLSLLNLAGKAGMYLNYYSGRVFGFGKFYIPFVFIIVSFFLMAPRKKAISGMILLAAIFMILSLNGLVHLARYKENIYDAARVGLGGGYAGLALSYPFSKAAGVLGGSVLLFALFLISLFLFFNTSAAGIFGAVKILAGFFKNTKVKTPVPGLGKENEVEVEFSTKSIPLDPLPESSDEAAGEKAVSEMEKSEEISVRKKFPKIDIPIELLDNSAHKPKSGDIASNQEIIQKTLANFNIPIELGEVNIGPTVTQYAIKPAEGIKLSKIVSLNDNLALALAAHPIRIEAPIPGKSLVGIEVPNKTSAIVSLRSMIESNEFKGRKSNLMMAIGKDVKGAPWFGDVAKMPHLLIAGSTGSGKSVCINSMIISLLYQNSPEDLKFIFVDPKRVELPVYNGIPHLLTPVITDVKKTMYALRWTIIEMERRFDKLSEFHKRDIQGFNKSMEERMPYIIFVIDELADLMAAAGPEIEGLIIRLAQMARAVGIHLVLATQRPSVDVITGLIKANITTRLAFSVASAVDSRTILDMSGAEKLLGRGDMLFMTADLSKPKRLQGAYASEEEIKKVIGYLKSQAEPEYIDEIVEKSSDVSGINTGSFSEDAEDDLLPEAKKVIVQAKKASASLLQRRLRIGYARAARLLDLLEKQGIIGPGDGAKPREILIEHSDEVEENGEKVDEEEE